MLWIDTVDALIVSMPSKELKHTRVGSLGFLWPHRMIGSPVKPHKVRYKERYG